METNNVKIFRKDTSYGRTYVINENGKNYQLFSVTTILSFLKSPKLEELKNSMTPEVWEKISKRGANRGTCMHLFLENYFKNFKETNDHENSFEYTRKVTPEILKQNYTNEEISLGLKLFYNYYYSGFLKSVKAVHYTEKFIYNIEDRYAGTLDFMYADEENQYVIGDFKSSSGKIDDEKLFKYKLQISAYSKAIEKMKNIEIERAKILVSYDDELDTFEIDKNDIDKYYKKFKKLAISFYESLNL